jgi:hypothetical protein
MIGWRGFMRAACHPETLYVTGRILGAFDWTRKAIFQSGFEAKNCCIPGPDSGRHAFSR